MSSLDGTGTPAFTEKHYSCSELAEPWGLDANTIRRIFQDEPGVFRIGHSGRRGRRDYTTIRIPASVAAKVYAERTKAM